MVLDYAHGDFQVMKETLHTFFASITEERQNFDICKAAISTCSLNVKVFLTPLLMRFRDCTI